MTVLAMVAAVVVAAPSPAQAIELGVPQVLADGLVLPWEVLPLGDGRLLISEKAGRIRVWIPETGLQTAPVYQEPGTEFLGMARHPNFTVKRFVYAYVNLQTGPPSPQNPNGTFENRVIRLHDNGSQLEFSATVLGGIPGERNHDAAAGSALVRTACSTS
jgi:glucose/arabinose dehydrogenase